MKHLDVKAHLFEQLAAIARAVGSAHRLELLEHLAQGERCVEALAGRAGLGIANASHHLQQLRRAGVVKSRRDGKRIIYRLADDSILALLGALRTVAERNVAEVRQVLDGYFRDRDNMEPVSRRELMKRLKEDSVTLLDVRPEDEFALGHLPGALNIPLTQLERRLRLLPKGRDIVAYCRGPYCVLAFEAVAALRRRGYVVRRLEDGFPEWKAAGFAIEAGA